MVDIDRWKGLMPDDELANFRKAEFGGRVGIGARPALLNIDTTNVFVDPKYRLCGDTSELQAALARVTNLFRTLDLPIYYTRRDNRKLPQYRGMWNVKMGVSRSADFTSDPRGDEWPEAYAPRPQDVVLQKNKPSVFWGTPLESFLRYDRVDSLVVVGIATSGCVRASVVDAFSHNFRIVIVEEACGDTSTYTHRANLFDMDMKYGDVESIDHVQAVLTQKFGRAATSHERQSG